MDTENGKCFICGTERVPYPKGEGEKQVEILVCNNPDCGRYHFERRFIDEAP